LTWKLKGTKYNRLLFQLQPKTHRIAEIDAGSSEFIPTPQASDYIDKNTSKSWEAQGGVNFSLGNPKLRAMLPTPRTADAEGGCVKNVQMENGNYFRTNKEGVRWGVKLRDVVESGMLPTPNARDWKDTIGNGTDAPSIGVTRGYSLGQKINSMLPTPTAMDSTNATATMKSTQVKEGSMHSVTLTRLLCTPTAQSGRGNTSDKRGKGNLTDQIAEMEITTSKTSQLNPRFVAEMMGFPPNWTELPFQSGERNPSKDMETP
jgi:hypothetical protein